MTFRSTYSVLNVKALVGAFSVIVQLRRLIINSTPQDCFAMGPNHTLTGSTCLECLQECEAECPRCGWPLCEQCQAGPLPHHSLECATLTASRDKIDTAAMKDRA